MADHLTRMLFVVADELQEQQKRIARDVAAKDRRLVGAKKHAHELGEELRQYRQALMRILLHVRNAPRDAPTGGVVALMAQSALAEHIDDLEAALAVFAGRERRRVQDAGIEATSDGSEPIDRCTFALGDVRCSERPHKTETAHTLRFVDRLTQLQKQALHIEDLAGVDVDPDSGREALVAHLPARN